MARTVYNLSEAWTPARAAALAVLACAPVSADVDFNRDVRPILANRCFKCHGPDEAARQAGLRLDRLDGATAPRRGGGFAIVPGDPVRSRLVERITSRDDDVRMPPPEIGSRLSDEEIALLTRWIESGATFDPHWAFTTPVRPAPPDVGDDAWPRNDIDRFVLARLEREGLDPATEADRATLIRRVSLDLTGLPPTPEEVDAFERDPGPRAYEAVVDRLLASPHYGERWARVWLDLARYADTKGYEADRRRTIWPYRDWVIDAFNRDLPFDEFTVEQLAGDLLEEPGDEQVLATAFHRNTMTNDEGGTDDEEFRVAAVVDRVNTTAEVWMGLTMACAQCHAHKFDPITHEEYYRFFAFFDDTADADAMDERPLLALLTGEQRERQAEIARERAEVEARIGEALATLDYRDPGPAPVVDETADGEVAVDYVWIDDDLPPGARPIAGAAAGPWEWVSAGEHPVASGRRASRRTSAGGVDQHFFTDAFHPLEIAGGDVLFAHVFIDPVNPPRSIMVQWHDGTSWEHRAYWGEPLIPWGSDGSPSRLPRGEVPDAGAWVRLEVEAAKVGLRDGAFVAGVAFSQYDGTVLWDAAGVRTSRPPDDRHLVSQAAWEERVRDRDAARLPAETRDLVAIAPEERSDEQRRALRDFYLRNVHRESRAVLAPLIGTRDELRGAEEAITSAAPRVPVMRELPPAERRTTRIHRRGNFLDQGDAVAAGVPAALSALAGDATPSRLGLARWLVADDHPLTARVLVNRYWEQLFGVGIVATVEDFGVQGALPSHPALLDWLATELVANGWSLKSLCRTIVTSATYRQASARSETLRERDPRNRLLAAGPRFRLEAEMIRDQALAVSGLLKRTLHGPPVFPRQPDGIWQVIYSDDRWMESSGDDRHRRALYTFWRRTSPYPSMIAFDAPSREICVPRRIRTNTPLQALVTLNDPVYVEAAQALARLVVDAGGSDPASRAAFAFRRCLARRPSPAEIDTLVDLYETELAHYRAHPDDAVTMATDPLGPLPEGRDPPKLAAWTIVCNVLMNLDEFLTKQ